MTPELTALRQRFMEQVAGLSVFEELCLKYEQVLAQLTNLETRWRASVPANLAQLEAERTDYKQALTAIGADPTASDEVKATAIASLRRWSRP